MEPMGQSVESPFRNRIGTWLRGKYRIDRLVGVGGMAAVFSATHRNGNRVAIKVLHPMFSLDEDMRRRFRREGQLANRVGHPGAVCVLDDDTTEDGCAFLVMPLLVGETLQQRCRRRGGKLGEVEALVAAHALLGVLRAAHAQGVVHRDIKPENILVTDDGALHVLDFGIARCVDLTGQGTATHAGRAVGTPAFMAPEQALGRGAEVDAQTDLWAVGATLFTCIAGVHVHPAESGGEMLVVAATRKARSLGDVMAGASPAVIHVVDRALAFDKRDRWKDAGEMLDAVREAHRFVSGEARFDERLPADRPPPSGPSTDGRSLEGDVASVATGNGGAFAFLPTEKSPLDAAASGTSGTLRPAARTVEPGPRGRPRSIRWATVAVLATAGVGGLGLWSRPHGAAAKPSAVSIADDLAAARSAWMDGNVERSADRLAHALQVEPKSAEAHLAMVRMGSFWPDEAMRSHFVQAQEGRAGLTPAEREYVDALAPAMAVPADFRGAADRLASLHARRPQDLEVSIALADARMRIADLDGAIEALAEATRGSDVPAVAYASLGSAQGLRDDVDAARATFRRCVASFPAASVCAGGLAQLELLEGNCADAERATRQWIASSPSTASAHLFLAYALDAQGASSREVEPVLERWAQLASESIRPLDLLRAKQKIALREGRLHDALDLDGQLATALQAIDDDAERFDYAINSIFLKTELGLNDAARDTLQHYADTRQELKRDTYGGDNVMYLYANATYLGLLPWNEWTRRRDTRLADHSDRDGLLDGPQRSWLEYFAMPTTTTEGANEALRAIDRYLPILHRTDRWPAADMAIGTVFSLGGRPSDATPHFDRAIRSCTKLDDPIANAHLMLAYADHFRRTGDVPAACSRYRTLLQEWPVSTGSITSAKAQAVVKSICTAVPKQPSASEKG